MPPLKSSIKKSIYSPSIISNQALVISFLIYK